MVVLFNLVQLDRLVNDFGGAIALLDHVEIEVKKILILRRTEPILFSRALHMYKIWAEMAGRDAAATIFHFGLNSQWHASTADYLERCGS